MTVVSVEPIVVGVEHVVIQEEKPAHGGGGRGGGVNNYYHVFICNHHIYIYNYIIFHTKLLDVGSTTARNLTRGRYNFYTGVRIK